MKLKVLLILMLAAVTFTSYAQDGGIRGKEMCIRDRSCRCDGCNGCSEAGCAYERFWLCED